MNTLIARTLVLLFLAATALHAQTDNTMTDCTDAWLERASGAPPARDRHTGVWTGSEMIVWGGRGYNHVRFNSGGRYNPAANSWTAVNPTGAPTARSHHTAVWTGTEMIVWGGGATEGGGGFNTGGRYNPATDSWTQVTTTGAPAARTYHTAVWTGSEMIVWGGASDGQLNGNRSDGGRYNPASNSWTAIPNTLPNTPSVRSVHTTVWSGSEMIVWGGVGAAGTSLKDGGRYNPAGNTWAAVSTIGAPEGRWIHPAVWTGSEMIVWGGYLDGLSLNTGGRYRPADNSWTAVTTTGAPSRRYDHTAVWTGGEMIVWGGTSGFNSFMNTGGRYNPTRDSWTEVNATGAPAERLGHTAVWTGSEMIVWGGSNPFSTFNDTFSYIPDCGALRITNAVLDGGNLILSFPTVSGRTYTLWRSDTLTIDPWTDTGLAALTGTGATLTFTLPAPPAGVPKRFFRVHAVP